MLPESASARMPASARTVLGLLVVSVGVIAVGVVLDVRTRPVSVETVVRRYFAALEAGDVDAALSALAPPVSARDATFVANAVGNRYHVRGIAVRHPSLVARLRGEPAGPRDVTVFLEITQAIEEVQWQAGPTVPVVEIDGRWYLGRPPLAPG